MLILSVLALILFDTYVFAQQKEATFATQKILEFEQLAGQPEWATNAQNRLTRTVWHFMSDGSLSMERSTDDSVSCTYEKSRRNISFHHHTLFSC